VASNASAREDLEEAVAFFATIRCTQPPFVSILAGRNQAIERAP
jgi:hypothetical protein